MSTFTWTLPSTLGAVGTAASDARDQAAILYGRDIWFDVSADTPNYIVTPSGDWKIVEAREALRQSLLRRLITAPDEWPTLEDFGVGARRYVKARNIQSVRDEIVGRIRGQFLRDDRVEQVNKIVVSQLAENAGLHYAITVTPIGRLRTDDPLLVQAQVI
jgi:hypothetical protein